MALQLTRAALATLLVACASAASGQSPGTRVLLDAHNCYPYNGKWADRLSRAMSTGVPVAIEQDLVWYADPATGLSRSIVSHGKPYTGSEPSLEEYFFAAVAPTLREALAKGNDGSWPLVTLNIDFKDSSVDHCRAVWQTLKKFEELTTSAAKTSSIAELAPLELKPLLILASGAGGQFTVFYDEVAASDKLLVFGAAQTDDSVPAGVTGEDRMRFVASRAPDTIVAARADNFRRWWNNSWHAVEAGGAPRAGEWTEEDSARLKALVDHAHALGYWIRFYTLNGHTAEESLGWDRGYNFGSREAVRLRWRAAIAAGVDFVATDMYEDFGALNGASGAGGSDQ